MAYGGFTEEWYAERLAKDQAAKARGVTAADCRSSDGCETLTTVGKTPGGEGVGKNSPQQIQRPEQKLQIDAAKYLELALPPPLRFMHIPNGGHRTQAEAGIFKAMGQKPGAADLLILGWRSFIWLELKSPKGRLSEDQKGWRDWCASIGAPWFLIRSLEDLEAALESLQIRLRVLLYQAGEHLARGHGAAFRTAGQLRRLPHATLGDARPDRACADPEGARAW